MAKKYSKKLIGRVQKILLNPKEFWLSQKSKKTTRIKLITSFFMPFLGVIALAVFLGEFFGSAHFFMGYAIMKAIRKIVLLSVLYLIVVYATNELLKAFGGQKNIQISERVVVYSMTPFLLISIFTGLFPYFYVLDVLGLYSFYLYWIGAKEMFDVPEQNFSSYIILNIVIGFFTLEILSIVFSKLLAIYF